MNFNFKIYIFLFSISFVIFPIKLFYYYYLPQTLPNILYSAPRLDIVDSKGNILATTVKTYSLYAIPYDVAENLSEIAKNLSKILELDEAFIFKRLNMRSKFVWIKRHITPKQKNAIYQLGYAGLFIAKDCKRFYPHKDLCSHLIGNVDEDNEGLTGIELAYNDYLKDPKNKPLALSINLYYQHVLMNEILNAKHKYHSQSACGIIACVKTGKILAIFAKTDDSKNFNPNIENRSNETDPSLKSRFELGSIFKVVAAAMFLEEKFVDLDTLIFAESSFKLNGYSIKDVLGQDKMRRDNCCYTFQEAFQKSSNVVFANLAYKNLDNSLVLKYFKNLGLLDGFSIDNLKVVSSRYPKKWRKANTVTSTYGYGINVAPLTFLQAFLRIITGKKMTLHILQKVENEEKEDLFSLETVQKIRVLLKKNAEKAESYKKFKGLNMGGKTGTSMKLVQNEFGKFEYDRNSHVCSYVFFYPFDNPSVAGLVLIDNPKSESNRALMSFLCAMPVALNIVEKISVDHKASHDVLNKNE